MLKRLLFAVALAVSTLLATGAVTGAAQASEPRVCSSAQQPPGQCMERSDGCTYCYSYRTGSWERRDCSGD
jgi:hypothetical protein